MAQRSKKQRAVAKKLAKCQKRCAGSKTKGKRKKCVRKCMLCGARKRRHRK